MKMGLLLLIMGCCFFVIAGDALTKFRDTHDYRWAIVGVIKMLLGGYFVIAAIGALT